MRKLVAVVCILVSSLLIVAMEGGTNNCYSTNECCWIYCDDKASCGKDYCACLNWEGEIIRRIRCH